MAGAGFISPDAIRKYTLGLKPGGGRTPADRAALARGGFNIADSSALGAAAGAGLLAGSIGVTSGLEGASLGAIAINPAFAIPGAALLIGELTGLIPSFSGRPKMLDTIQAVQRLAQSRDPEIQQLARNFMIYVRNGEPISSSNPRVQAQIRDWIAGAIGTILSRAGLQNNQNAVGELDTVLRHVLTRDTSTPASTLDATIARLTGSAMPSPITGLDTRQPASQPLARRAPYLQPSAPSPMPPMPVSGQSGQLPANTPPGLAQIVMQAARSLAHNEWLRLVGCVGAFVVNEGFGLRCVEELLAEVVYQEGKRIVQAARDFMQSFQRGVTQPPPLPISPPQPAPLLDTKTPCPSCDRVGRQQLQRLDEQEQRVIRDIRTEQSQDIEERLSQQEQQLTQLEQQETQPAAQRDIGRELEQKRALQTQIQQERYQLESGGQQGGQLPPGGEPAPVLKEDQRQEIQHEIHDELEHEDMRSKEERPITFCMGCKNEEDAIMFLNGEPSACSVMPGTTKYIGQGAQNGG